MNPGDIKNKYIVHEGVNYRPWVERYGRHPIKLELCETIHQAQIALSLYPPDCWDGYLSQVEERKRYGRIL